MKTINLKLPRARAWFELSTPAAATICIFALLAIASLIGKIHTAPPVAAVPTPALSVIIFATSPAIVVPTVAPAIQVAAVQPGNVTTRAIGVFGAPDTGSYIGSVESGRTFVPLSMFGSEWTRVDMSGGTGVVFVRTADLYGVPELDDLKPTDVPHVVYVAAQSPQEAAGATQAIEAVSTPAAAQIAAHEQPTMQPAAAAIYDRQQWAMQAARAQP